MTVPGRPMVIAHRGDCGQFPEHTPQAYASAHYAGADFNELDLAVTKDNRLVVFHNPTLSEVTNIGCDTFPEFCPRMIPYFEIKENRGIYKNDFLINDFTWEEIQTLRARQRMDTRNTHLDDIFPKMTLEDAIELQMKLNEEHPHFDGRPFKTGLYIETKNVGFYNERGVDIAGLLYTVLKKYGLETVSKCQYKLPIIVESFEKETLIDFRFKYNSDLPLIFLMHDWVTDYNLEEIAKYSHGIGPKWTQFFNILDPLDYQKSSKLIEDAHRLGLMVHGYIFQNDVHVYPDEDAITVLDMWLHKKVDGVFTEFTQTTYDHFMNLKAQDEKRKKIESI